MGDFDKYFNFFSHEKLDFKKNPELYKMRTWVGVGALVALKSEKRRPEIITLDRTGEFVTFHKVSNVVNVGIELTWHCLQV